MTSMTNKVSDIVNNKSGTTDYAVYMFLTVVTSTSIYFTLNELKNYPIEWSAMGILHFSLNALKIFIMKLLFFMGCGLLLCIGFLIVVIFVGLVMNLNLKRYIKK